VGNRVIVRSESIAGGTCLCVLGIILTAGLWPFHIPSNQVKWLKSRNGLQFGRHGSAVTSGPIQSSSPDNASATLEIWLNPSSSENSSTILSFDASGHPGEPLSLHQRGETLIIRRNNVDPQGISRTALFYLDHVFHENNSVFLTIVLNSREALTYVNGTLAKISPLSGAWNDLTGRAVLANALTTNDSWSGTIFGLAIYQYELTASQITADYESWKTKWKPVRTSSKENAAAVYLLDERGGAIAHNLYDASTCLTIPTRYFILHPRFLLVPWKEYHPAGRGYWYDIVVNILGFIPLGACFFIYFSLLRSTRYPGIATIFLGLFTSLVIEVLQVFLPTRSSDMTDVITNTLGATIGVMISRKLYRTDRMARIEAITARKII
jgi:VanZ family protein